MTALREEKKSKITLKAKEPTEDMDTQLNKAVQLLIDQMPDHVGELIQELSAQTYISKWQLVGGILFEAYNGGYLSAYTLDPAWKDGFRAKESKCGFCKDLFMPKRIGQLFCCNECGQGRPKIGQESEEVKKETKKNVLDTPKPNKPESIPGGVANKSDNKGPKSGWTDGALG